MPESQPLFALIAGGGTGGHVMPGLALAEALVTRGHNSETIEFFGSSRGLEATLVPAAGFRATLYPLKSFPRKLTLGHVDALWRLVKATVGAIALVGRRRPRVVVSVGGYASLPALAAARMRRVPIVVLSYDAIPGRSSLFAGRMAKCCAVAFAESPLPRKVVTGAAIRAEILAVDRVSGRSVARTALGLPGDRLVVTVVGGSQGSGALNDVIDAFVRDQADRTDIAIRHVVGARNDDGARVSLDGSAGLLYQVVGYEPDMASVYAASDILLARAGATTVFEIAAVGIASILVPWPQAAEDHQSANARSLSSVGGAVLLPESELTVKRLVSEIDRLSDPAQRELIVAAARSVGHRDGASRIAQVVEDCAAP